MGYEAMYRRSIEAPEAFWAEQAQAIHWHVPPRQILDYSRPPFRRWFVGGETNLCHNAVDRHLVERGDQLALAVISTEANTRRHFSYRELYREVNEFAAVLLALGVGRGDRVVVYMPNMAEAVFATLACARIGAIHSVVFGGFAAHNLALRIDDARAKLLICADAGLRAGKTIRYKPLVDEALGLAQFPPEHVLIVSRGLDEQLQRVPGRDLDYADLKAAHAGAEVPVTWLESNEPSYLLYTSGTTGKPKGVQRDVGGHAVALALSMRTVFDVGPGQVMFSTSDVGWAVGHSYNIYGPLLVGATSLLYEGLPIHPDPGIWWQLCAEYGVRTVFSSPTAIRVLKKQDPAFLTKHDLSSLKALFLAGEPLDEPTATWIAGAINKPIIDNYWQTETGWPILAICNGVEQAPTKFGSPGKAVYGYDVRLIDETSAEEITEPGRKGVIAVEGPLPPGCLQTIWGDDARYVKTYWSTIHGRTMYNTFDWGVRDEDGYFFILGRTDDVINVAGHRLGTREIEESISSHPAVAEVAVVGVADQLKGQVAMAFAVLKDANLVADPAARLKLEGEVMKTVDGQLGAVARPARIHFVSLLPKTRSGKMLRRAIQAVCEQRDPGDLTTMDDPTALQQIRDLVAAK